MRRAIFVSHHPLLLVGTTLLVMGCRSPTVPGGEITVRNDIMDREYNVVSFTSSGGGGSFGATLKPGSSVRIPRRGVEWLRFTRKYEGYSREYEVNCPRGFDKKITMKLIDVHTNRLPGGCRLTKRGVAKNGFTTWEK